MKQQKIVVTGASGYIASWIVKKLLDEGHTVHGTVRSLSNEAKIAPLKKIERESKGTLKLFEADLLKEGSFDESVKGCNILMHTASPFTLTREGDPFEQFINPAVKGTENVLGAATKSGTVKRVILTSSVAAITNCNVDIKRTKEGKFTEEYWNEETDPNVDPYRFSKTAAEKRAWEIAQTQNNWELVVINPGGVLGPSLTDATISGSVDMLKQILGGDMAQGVPALGLGMVDVRDVADAHISAAFNSNATGRYILVEKYMAMMDVANVLRPEFGDKIALPKKVVPKFLVSLMAKKIGFTKRFVKDNIGIIVNFDNSKSKNDLGIVYNKVDEGLIEFARNYLANKSR